MEEKSCKDQHFIKEVNLNKKERVIASIKFKEVDKIPTMYRAINFISKKLMKHFEIGNQNDPWLLEKNHEKLMEALGIDFWSSGCNIGKFSNFIPEYTGPVLEYMDNNYYSAIGIPTKPKTIPEYEYTFTEIISNPLRQIESVDDVKGFLTRKLDYFNYDNLINNATNLNSGRSDSAQDKKIINDLSINNLISKSEDFLCMGSVLSSPFMLCSYLRGMDRFLCDLAGNIKMAEAIVNEVKDFVLEFNKRYLNGAAGKCEYFACWDDVAMQNGLMFPPKDFIKYFLPVWKELISMVKSAGMFFSWHCCGNVNEVLPVMIDAGIDVFDVVQTSAKDMEIEKFYKKFGKAVCIHGGIDVQKLLASGSHYEIREEVKKIRNLWGKNGGIIIGPSHEIVPETDIENVLTLYDELKK